MDPRLREYARLAVRLGVNLQKGQTLLLRAPVSARDFARLAAEEAYAAGAREVVTEWYDDALSRLRYLHASEEVFDHLRPWEKEKLDTLASEDFAQLSIYAEDPEALSGVDPERIRRWSVARGKALEDYYDKMMRSDFSWCLVSVPVEPWARKVFPGLSGEEAVSRLWDAIYETLRITGDGRSFERWEAHDRELSRRAERLSGMDLRSLHYESGLGTDFTVELPAGYRFLGGSEKNRKGVSFIANMPTEEIFTAPKKTGSRGVLAASRPLCLNGTLVKDIRFTVEDGRIVKAEASEGLEILMKTLEVDEGSRYFGELALVDKDSPISRQGILYYNTLFDENASCHIAFGNAYPDCVAGGENLSGDEYGKVGINSSLTHEDFMIGTDDLSITGLTRSGEKIPVFRNGSFAF